MRPSVTHPERHVQTARSHAQPGGAPLRRAVAARGGRGNRRGRRGGRWQRRTAREAERQRRLGILYVDRNKRHMRPVRRLARLFNDMYERYKNVSDNNDHAVGRDSVGAGIVQCLAAAADASATFRHARHMVFPPQTGQRPCRPRRRAWVHVVGWDRTSPVRTRGDILPAFPCPTASRAGAYPCARR